VIALVISASRLQRLNKMREISISPPAAQQLSNEELLNYLNSGDTIVVNNTLTFIEAKKDPFAVEKARVLLKSKDDYTWLCASMYLGACGNDESIPYLIKGLRHTAWRSDPRRVEYLQKITGQKFGTNFVQWKAWYEGSGGKANFDWDSSLGASPRL
jgi:hypothetical protein